MSGIKQMIRLSADRGGALIANMLLDPDYPWPPPEDLWVVFPHSSPTDAGVWISLEPADELAELMSELGDSGMDLRYTATKFHQVACSKLSDEVVAHPSVARGAEYVPIEGVAE